MKLFYSPFHTFIHKVLVTAHEAGLWDEITFVPTYPFKNRDGEDQGDAYSIVAVKAFPGLSAVVFDLPPVAEVTPDYIAEHELLVPGEEILARTHTHGYAVIDVEVTAGSPWKHRDGIV